MTSIIKGNYVSPLAQILTVRVERGFLGNSDSQPSPVQDGDFTTSSKTGEGLGNGASYDNQIFS